MALDVNIFYSHNINERLQIVKQRGEYISWIKYYGFYLNLHVVDHYFVEVYYNSHNNKVEQVEILNTHEERLNLFAAQVNLEEINRLL